MRLLRFALTGDLCNSWKAVGGLAAQLSHISIALHLGIAENAAFAIAYDNELRNRIQRLARRRGAALDFGKLLIGENDEVKRYLRPLDLGKEGGNIHGATTFDSSRRPRMKGFDPNAASKGVKPSGANTKGETTPGVPKRKGKGWEKRGPSSDAR